ncbi:hypothetical protein EIN_057440 [Entamoeba invadens IP1]|uniref:hypothetical protein n=1 Tax=Entamoeba invadens IP1 TaxID=370355 RepID=UPI0002C3F1C7|nr:hypothetical protein EIN_057440 [Entamoeba invadens IP1]ELP93349.1 hypothetical protein EIN_057440 [Entamoeba invadens IP1]|eukprot:XP_004260120.1 hypothetical protein EIN_057440 [Entamoeba invadens IP1]
MNDMQNTVQHQQGVRVMKRKDKQFFDYKNYMVCQQAICIALLNKSFEVHIQHPTKKSVVTPQFIRVKTLKQDQDELNVVNFIEERCLQRAEWDKANGIKDTTASRRVPMNKNFEAHHLFIDFLRDMGYSFASQYTSGKNSTLKVETITAIYKDGKLLLNKRDICRKGQMINRLLCQSVLQQKDRVFAHNDASIANLFRNF